MVPINIPPSATGPSSKPTATGTATGNNDGIIISLIAAVVSRSTALPYSGLPLPSIMPLISRNWRRTSSTTAPAARPTASIAMAANRNGIKPPINNPIMTIGSLKSNLATMPASSSL